LRRAELGRERFPFLALALLRCEPLRFAPSLFRLCFFARPFLVPLGLFKSRAHRGVVARELFLSRSRLARNTGSVTRNESKNRAASAPFWSLGATANTNSRASVTTTRNAARPSPGTFTAASRAANPSASRSRTPSTAPAPNSCRNPLIAPDKIASSPAPLRPSGKSVHITA
jgi:hypothetical protein